jgi:hypothetical protein
MRTDSWRPIREARLAKEAAALVEETRLQLEQDNADIELVAKALSKHPELTQTPGLPGEAGAAGLQGEQGEAGEPGAPAAQVVRVAFERDFVQVTLPDSGMRWAEVVVGATTFFDDGSTEHSTVLRDANGMSESIAVDAPTV